MIYSLYKTSSIFFRTAVVVEAPAVDALRFSLGSGAAWKSELPRYYFKDTPHIWLYKLGSRFKVLEWCKAGLELMLSRATWIFL